MISGGWGGAGRREYWDLGVTPCGARLGIRKGEKGAVHLPKILVPNILGLAAHEVYYYYIMPRGSSIGPLGKQNIA